MLVSGSDTAEFKQSAIAKQISQFMGKVRGVSRQLAPIWRIRLYALKTTHASMFLMLPLEGHEPAEGCCAAVLTASAAESLIRPQ